ncbi:MAG: adenosine deaminase [Cellvibrionaceae bacterium]|jgi:adenosine deaminase
MNSVENQAIQSALSITEVSKPLNTACRQFNDLIIYNRLKLLPKVDIHRHFEGSLRISTLSEIANKFSMDIPSDPILLAPMVQMIGEKPDPHRFLAKFGILRTFYQSPAIIKRLAYEVVADAAMDNVKYLELRFSPQALAAQRGYPLDKVTDWVIESVQEAAKKFDITVNLIVTLVRHHPLHEAQRVAEIAMSRKESGIVGLDLAGDEINFPADLFTNIFREAKQEGLKITIHAGEWMGAETVKQAIVDLQADRIGHGVRAAEDQSVLSLIRERQIPLEMSLASNEQTASVSSIKQHPLKDLLTYGIKVTINADDPSICAVTMTDELALAAEHLKMNFMSLYDLTCNGLDAAFICDQERKELKSYIQRTWSKIDKIGMMSTAQA